MSGSTLDGTVGGGAVAAAGRRGSALDRYLALHVALAALAALACTLVWAFTPPSGFWPAWVWFGAGLSAAAHAGAASVAHLSPGPRRTFVTHAVADALIIAALLLVWAMTDRHAWWPAPPVLGLCTLLAVHAILLALAPRSSASEAALSTRVAELTRTRRDAVEVQTVELRRIERDLHDGAQARLVALSMQLGRAQRALGALPGTLAQDGAAGPSLATLAASVDAAREHADAAIAELRALVQGIAPPILTDRGLAEAVRALGRRAGVPVQVRADITTRPPAAVEVAAYFVVAEALTNAVKHAVPHARPSAGPTEPVAGAAPGTVRIGVEVTGTATGLTVQVTDDGPGGADPSGGGLHGLAQRVAALDGRFSVSDAPGGGTVVRAVVGYER